jgi:hypothetical protein
LPGFITVCAAAVRDVELFPPVEASCEGDVDYLMVDSGVCIVKCSVVYGSKDVPRGI